MNLWTIPFDKTKSGRKWFWKGCKPNSVFTLADGENHLSQQPIPGTRPALAGPERAAPGFPIWPCTRWGFPCRVAFASRGALLPHLFTLAPTSSPMSGRFNFLWHYPSGRLASPPPACIPEGFRGYAASRPLVFGLSSPLFLGAGDLTSFAVGATSKTGFQPAIRKSGAILRPSKTMGRITDWRKNLKWRISTPAASIAGLH